MWNEMAKLYCLDHHIMLITFIYYQNLLFVCIAVLQENKIFSSIFLPKK
jgi:hypothetical protein